MQPSSPTWPPPRPGWDVETLDRQLAPDFTGIGPLGFTLTKANWLDRHATGAITHNTFRIEEQYLRPYGDTAGVTAHQITFADRWGTVDLTVFPARRAD